MQIDLILEKLNETKISQINSKKGRYYLIENNPYKFLSVSTILSLTQSEEKTKNLNNWKQKVGNEEANKISNLSLKRGTIMHDCLELYFENFNLNLTIKTIKNKYENLFYDIDIIRNGLNMFYNMFKTKILSSVKQSIKREFPIYNFWENENKFFGYSGTVDHFCINDQNEFTVIDYKNSIKPKKEEWITDYKIQISAYIKGIEFMTNTEIPNGKIWIMCQSNDFQEFKLNKKDIEYYFNVFKEKTESI